jgi:hypothetical protein
MSCDESVGEPIPENRSTIFGTAGPIQRHTDGFSGRATFLMARAG